MRHYLLLVAICTLFSAMNPQSAGVMELSIDDIQYGHGTLWIGVYASEDAFLDQNKAELRAVKVRNVENKKVYINNLAYGEYAVALFHDLNNNGKMDFNWMGVPEEPFAFSRPVPSKWRVPKFSEVKVGLYQSHKTIRTHLKNWWQQ